MFDNLRATGSLTTGTRLPAQAVMLAVTAPGARHTWDENGEVITEGLPWDEEWCSQAGEHTHSWNRTADGRWSKLHRRARERVVRSYGKQSVVLLTRVIEVQARGVKHYHPVLLATTPRQRAAVQAYRNALADLAPAHGFGFVSEKVKPQEATASAAYLSAYLITGKKEKAQLQHSVQHPAMRKSRVVWMTPRLTQQTGVTMRELRFRRFVFARYGTILNLGGQWVHVARRLAELERDRGRPLTGEEMTGVIDNDLALTLYLAVRDQEEGADAA
jgi:hypothetical protein